MSDLPADRERALAAIAAGWGRTATAAHPLCRCGKPYLPTCSFCNAKPGKPCRAQYDGDELHHGRRERNGTARDCPVHRT
jgi:hypothetical protein